MIDAQIMRTWCRHIDIKHALPFDDSQSAAFVSSLLAAFGTGDKIHQAKYLNTLLNVRDLSHTLTPDMQNAIDHAFDEWCQC